MRGRSAVPAIAADPCTNRRRRTLIASRALMGIGSPSPWAGDGRSGASAPAGYSQARARRKRGGRRWAPAPARRPGPASREEDAKPDARVQRVRVHRSRDLALDGEGLTPPDEVFRVEADGEIRRDEVLDAETDAPDHRRALGRDADALHPGPGVVEFRPPDADAGHGVRHEPPVEDRVAYAHLGDERPQGVLAELPLTGEVDVRLRGVGRQLDAEVAGDVDAQREPEGDLGGVRLDIADQVRVGEERA